MEKTLDFNSVQRPALLVTMKDEEKTQIHIGMPTESLVEELQVASQELEEVLRVGDRNSIDAIYDLAARLISCNREFLKVSAADLRARYGLNLEDLVLFFSVYIDFVDEIGKAKN